MCNCEPRPYLVIDGVTIYTQARKIRYLQINWKPGDMPVTEWHLMIAERSGSLGIPYYFADHRPWYTGTHTSSKDTALRWTAYEERHRQPGNGWHTYVWDLQEKRFLGSPYIWPRRWSLPGKEFSE